MIKTIMISDLKLYRSKGATELLAQVHIGRMSLQKCCTTEICTWAPSMETMLVYLKVCLSSDQKSLLERGPIEKLIVTPFTLNGKNALL